MYEQDHRSGSERDSVARHTVDSSINQKSTSRIEHQTRRNPNNGVKFPI